MSRLTKLTAEQIRWAEKLVDQRKHSINAAIGELHKLSDSGRAAHVTIEYDDTFNPFERRIPGGPKS